MLATQPRKIAPRQTPALWMLIVVQLDPNVFEWRPADIAELLPQSAGQVRDYCAMLWPEWEGQYYLDYDQAAILIYRVCRSARKAHDREELIARLQKDGLIDSSFPEGNARIERAINAIARYREGKNQP